MRLIRHRIPTPGGANLSRGKGFGYAKRVLSRMSQRASYRHIYPSPFPGAMWIVVALLGATVEMLCIALTVLTGPGPAFVIVPVGMLVLAAQLLWAKRFLQEFRFSHGGWSPRTDSA